MAVIGQVCYKVGADLYTNPTNLNITLEILDQIPVAQVTKLGIQAPQGTKFELNEKEFIMGRNGIFELEEGINITSIKFVPQTVYTKDETASQEKIDEGKAELDAAEATKDEGLAALPSEEDETYWVQYNTIYNTYVAAVEVALQKINLGLNGIYDPSTGTEDLKDIIIDYIEEEVT